MVAEDRRRADEPPVPAGHTGRRAGDAREPEDGSGQGGGDQMENRDIVIKFRVTPAEKARIDRKMHEVGIRCRSAYLRKMALDGYCINMKFDDAKEIIRLLRSCSANLNQVAKRANETGSIYEADIRDLQERLEEIWESQKEVMQKLAAIR